MIVVKWVTEYRCTKQDGKPVEWYEPILRVQSSSNPKYRIGAKFDFGQLNISTKEEGQEVLIQPLDI